MDVLRTRRRSLWSAAALTTLLVLADPRPAEAQNGSWGNTGAYYTDGIVCQTGSASVPLASWAVNGSATAYATSDILESNGVYRPAPISGSPAPIGAGQGGIAGRDVGAAAYLIAHHTGDTAGVAETSADIAAIAGDGNVQAQCLGQGGTTAAGAAAALTDARRHGGPYTVRVDVPATPLPGQSATITATVVSASGVPTPGIPVSFSANGTVSTAMTGGDGKARTSVPAPPAAVPVTATITEATSLTYFATTPASVALSAPTAVNGSTTLSPAAPPRPVVSVGTPSLVLASGAVTPVASIAGTYGYAGTGTIAVAGPVAPGAGKDCNSLGAADFARAPTAWTGQFNFIGDGPQRAGSTDPLTPGCYAATASLQTTNSTPSVRAVASFREGATVAVSTMQVAESSARTVATPGTLTSTITATTPGQATVSSTVLAYGPLTPRAGDCDGLEWAKAPQATKSNATPLTASSDASKLSATITAPEVSGLGCYALSARSVVTQGGRTATVQESIGRPAATTLVAMPTLTLVTSSYAGTQGKAMTGTLTVLGAYSFPGTVRIGLRAATGPPTAGCRDSIYEAVLDRGPPTSVATTGDGTYAFRTPIAPRNRCYAITGTLTLAANPSVRADSPSPSGTSVFLAGAHSSVTTFNDRHRATGSPTSRTIVAFSIAGGLLLILAVWVIARAYLSAREHDELGGGWSWRPYRGDEDSPYRPHAPPGPLP